MTDPHEALTAVRGIAVAVGDAQVRRLRRVPVRHRLDVARASMARGLAAVLPSWPAPRPWPRRRPWWQVLSLRMGWWTLVLAGGS